MYRICIHCTLLYNKESPIACVCVNVMIRKRNNRGELERAPYCVQQLAIPYRNQRLFHCVCAFWHYIAEILEQDTHVLHTCMKSYVYRCCIYVLLSTYGISTGRERVSSEVHLVCMCFIWNYILTVHKSSLVARPHPVHIYPRWDLFWVWKFSDMTLHDICYV